MVWGPAGTRRSVYLPSAPVTVLWPVDWTVTETLLSAEPSAARVTVPVTVPVSWAKATAGQRVRRRTAQERLSAGSAADKIRRIPKFLMEGANRMLERRRRDRANWLRNG